MQTGAFIFAIMTLFFFNEALIPIVSASLILNMCSNDNISSQRVSLLRNLKVCLENSQNSLRECRENREDISLSAAELLSHYLSCNNYSWEDFQIGYMHHFALQEQLVFFAKNYWDNNMLEICTGLRYEHRLEILLRYQDQCKKRSRPSTLIDFELGHAEAEQESLLTKRLWGAFNTSTIESSRLGGIAG